MKICNNFISPRASSLRSNFINLVQASSLRSSIISLLHHRLQQLRWILPQLQRMFRAWAHRINVTEFTSRILAFPVVDLVDISTLRRIRNSSKSIRWVTCPSHQKRIRRYSNILVSSTLRHLTRNRAVFLEIILTSLYHPPLGRSICKADRCLTAEEWIMSNSLHLFTIQWNTLKRRSNKTHLCNQHHLMLHHL
jgi:hypothetical protein